MWISGLDNVSNKTASWLGKTKGSNRWLGKLLRQSVGTSNGNYTTNIAKAVCESFLF